MLLSIDAFVHTLKKQREKKFTFGKKNIFTGLTVVRKHPFFCFDIPLTDDEYRLSLPVSFYYYYVRKTQQFF